MERREFENSFAKAFADAEVQPSERVWTNVELDLVKAESAKMKKRVFFWQMMAAASVSLAMIAGGIGFYAMQSSNDDHRLAYNQTREIGSANGEATGRNIESIRGSKDALDANVNGPESPNRDGGPTRGMNEESGASSQVASDAAEVKSAQGSDRKNGANNVVQQQQQQQQQQHSVNRSIQRDDVSITNQNNVASIQHQQNDGKSLSAGAQSHSDEITKGGANGVDATNGSSLAALTNANSEGDVITNNETRSENRLPDLYSTSEPKLAFNAKQEETSAADPVALMLQKARDRELELARSTESSKKKNDEMREKLWTSVAFSAGSFTAHGSDVRTPQQSFQSSFNTSSTVVDNQAKASGISYAFGVSMGTQISDRFVIQGGISYLTESASFTSTQAMQDGTGTFKAASLNDYRADASSERRETFIPTAPYSVNNSMEYISVPVQAGYLIVKKRFAWQLNAGVSTDLFIQNTVDPEGNIAETKQGRGAESPYRPLNFSGLLGSEFSYRFGDRYRLGINPGVRYPFSSIYKDELGIESTPLTFDVGLRFRYIFR